MHRIIKENDMIHDILLEYPTLFKYLGMQKAKENHNSVVDGLIKMREGLESHTLLFIQLFFECKKQVTKYQKSIDYIEKTNAPRYKNILGNIEAVYG